MKEPYLHDVESSDDDDSKVRTYYYFYNISSKYLKQSKIDSYSH